MIWRSKITKDTLLLYGQRDSSVSLDIERFSGTWPSSDINNGEYMFLWKNEPVNKAIPQAIVVSPSDEAEFLSFISAYLPQLSPITAYARVFTTDEWSRASTRSPANFADMFAEASLGLILCEAAAHELRTSDSVRYRTAAATHGFALARYAMQGFSLSDLHSVSVAWWRAKNMSGDPQGRFSEGDLIAPWLVLQHLAEPWNSDRIDIPVQVLVACEALLHGHSATPQILPSYYNDSLFANSGRSTREAKLAVFERYWRDLSVGDTPVQDITTSFVLGLLCSELSLGSLEHYQLLAEVANRFPASLLWYGLCAGLRRQGGVYSSFRGIGRLVVRELSRHSELVDVPSCDISLKELDVLRRRTGRFPDIPTLSSSYADIELAPCVTCSFSIANRKNTSSKDGAQMPGLGETSTVLRRVEELYDTLDKLRADIVGGQEQLLPFDKKRTKRPRRQ